MTHYTTTIKINGVWRNLLVVESDAPIEWGDQKNITFYSGEQSVTYYTDGLYQSYHRPDGHKYWFLYDPNVQELRATIDILMGVKDDELYD